MNESLLAERLRPFPLFRQFADTWRPAMGEISIRRFQKDDTLADHGTAAETLWLVLSGWVGLRRHTPDGKEVIIGLCTEGDLFGEAGLFPRANYPYTSQVISADTDVACIPASLIRRLVQQDAGLSQYVMQQLAERIAAAQVKLEQMTSLTAAQRIGCFLLRLCNQQTGGACVLHMPVEKHVVASYLGMKPETLSRSFQQLSPIGVRVQGADVTVDDIGALREFVCGSCGESGMCATEEDIRASTAQVRGAM